MPASRRAAPRRARARPALPSPPVPAQLLHAVEQLRRRARLREPRQLLDLAAGPDEDDGVLVRVEARARARHVVGDQQVAALAGELAARALDRVAALGGEADDHPGALAAADLGEDVRGARERERDPGALGPLLLAALPAGRPRGGDARP